MKNELKVELERAFKNTQFYISLGIGLIFVVAHYICDVLPVANLTLWAESSSYYPISLYAKWLGTDFSSVVTASFYFVLPIIAALPYLGSLFSDKSKGYIRNIVTRVPEKNYLAAKYVSVFLSAFAAVSFPLLLDLAVTATTLPALLPEPVAAQSAICNLSMFSGIYFSHPLIYILIYVFIDAFWTALFVCMFIPLLRAMSFYAEVILLPCLVHIFIYFVGAWFKAETFVPLIWLQPLQPYFGVNFGTIILESVAVIALTAILFLIERKRNDLSV